MRHEPQWHDQPLLNERSDRIKALRSLSTKSGRTKQQEFIVEGPQSVREALKHPEDVRHFYATPAAAERHPDIVQLAIAAGHLPHETTDDIIAVATDTTLAGSNAQGLLLVTRMPRPTLAGVLAARPQLIAVLNQVRDPGNAGTVIRVADAAGADAVIVTSGSVDVYNPKVVRSTAGSLFHIPVISGVEFDVAVAALREAGCVVLAADGAGETLLSTLQTESEQARYVTAAGGSSETPTLQRPTAWVFGNEAWGLHPEQRELADDVVRIPIYGHAESLNLAMAATVCLYASSRELNAAQNT